jgi:hypothetical protein
MVEKADFVTTTWNLERLGIDRTGFGLLVLAFKGGRLFHVLVGSAFAPICCAITRYEGTLA